MGWCVKIHCVTEGETRWSPPISGEGSKKETGTDPVEEGKTNNSMTSVRLKSVNKQFV